MPRTAIDCAYCLSVLVTNGPIFPSSVPNPMSASEGSMTAAGFRRVWGLYGSFGVCAPTRAAINITAADNNEMLRDGFMPRLYHLLRIRAQAALPLRRYHRGGMLLW